MKKRIKMVDIARESGVSITTVSHVINNTRPVKIETARKVLAVVEKFNYFKSIPASSLRGKSTKLIGLIVPDVANPIMAKLSKDVETAFYEQGFNITVCNSQNDFDKEIFYINALISRYVDAIIVLPVKNENKYLKIILDNQVPLIVVDREIKGLNTDYILVDNFQGFYKAAEFLLSLGHRRIVYIERPYDLSHNIGRFEGYCQALKDNNIEFNENFYIRSRGFNFTDGYSAMKEILNRQELPTAVLAFGDVIAIGAMRAITETGLRIPNDISVIGFDDAEINEYLFNSLSSVSWPTKTIAKEALKLLLRRKHDFSCSKKRILISPELNIRDSVARIEMKQSARRV